MRENSSPKKASGQGEEASGANRGADYDACSSKKVRKNSRGERRIKCCGGSPVRRDLGRRVATVCAELAIGDNGVKLVVGRGKVGMVGELLATKHTGGL